MSRSAHFADPAPIVRRLIWLLPTEPKPSGEGRNRAPGVMVAGLKTGRSVTLPCGTALRLCEHYASCRRLRNNTDVPALAPEQIVAAAECTGPGPKLSLIIGREGDRLSLYWTKYGRGNTRLGDGKLPLTRQDGTGIHVDDPDAGTSSVVFGRP